MSDPAGLAEDIVSEVSTVLIGLDDQIEYLTLSLLTRGHVLLEGVPGVAKTTLANCFAQATGLQFARIQLTPDTLPADITGSSVYRENTGEFVIKEGPIFSNVVVADEINRATPKTQSALLEAMAERQVSIEGDTIRLPSPFFVIATQNPIEMEGTFDLPEAQRDRFQIKLAIDLPETDTERELLSKVDQSPTMGPADIDQVVTVSEILDASERVAEIHSEPAVWEYILDIVAATRDHPDVEHGASPRGSIALLELSKARAAVAGREYVLPDDVKALLHPTLRHRLLLSTEAQLSDITPDEIIADIESSVTPPAGKVTDMEESESDSPESTSE